MWEDFVRELVRTMDQIMRDFAHFVPRFLEMLAIVLVGWVVAHILKVILRSVLKITRFDKLSEHTGATQWLRSAELPSLTELVSRVAFWVAWVGFILLGISVLGVVGIEPHVTSFFGFLPRLFAALVILFFGMLAASFFSRAALLSSVNAGVGSPRLISWAVRTMIILFVVSMAFEELGVGSRTVIVAFTLTFGSLMLGLALAFGLGGKELARKYLERRFARDGDESRDREDELSPL
jgi:Conserved TM helix